LIEASIPFALPLALLFQLVRGCSTQFSIN
jgi:hypothetical protein